MTVANDERLLVISRYFPPKVGGSAIVMGNLLGDFPGDFHLIRGMPGRVMIDPEFQVEVSQSFVEMPEFFGRYAWRLSHALFPAIIAAALKEHRKRPFTAVLGCWPLACDLEFAYGIHKLFRLPLYLYMHDLWSDLSRSAWGKRSVRVLERRYLRACRKVFCITDDAADFYRKAYGVDTFTLLHSVNWRAVREADRFLDPPMGPPRVAFCGAIFELMNHDSLVRINEAVQGITDAQMVMCTQTPAPPEQLGLRGDRLSMFSASRAESMRELQRSSVVCVPLAFNSYAPMEVRTVFPTKVLDYLICGRPILVHAPHDSYLAREARERGWGYVVDTPDAGALQEAILNLAGDVPLQRRLVAGAWAEARRRDARVIGRQLYEQVSSSSAQVAAFA